jgi:hypothetical protein
MIHIRRLPRFLSAASEAANHAKAKKRQVTVASGLHKCTQVYRMTPWKVLRNAPLLINSDVQELIVSSKIALVRDSFVGTYAKAFLVEVGFPGYASG